MRRYYRKQLSQLAREGGAKAAAAQRAAASSFTSRNARSFWPVLGGGRPVFGQSRRRTLLIAFLIAGLCRWFRYILVSPVAALPWFMIWKRADKAALLAKVN